MGELDESYVGWKDWDPAAFGKFSALDALYFAAETSIATCSTPARVLEIGFGNGAFLGWVRGMGVESFGIETNPVLIRRAKDVLGPDHVFDALDDRVVNQLRGTLTHVVAFDVIEHVPTEHLTALLRATGELLAPQGKIVLRFPNGDSPFGRITQHGDPTHVTVIGQQKLAYLARAAGLRVVEIRAPRLPLRGVGLLRGTKRLLLSAARSCFERGISLLYFAGRRVPFDPNYVAVLQRGSASVISGERAAVSS
jgi:SAM-dependent methyltransferase